MKQDVAILKSLKKSVFGNLLKNLSEEYVDKEKIIELTFKDFLKTLYEQDFRRGFFSFFLFVLAY